MGVAEMMRREWDERARKNSYHYIASWKKDWDINSFLASGEEDYRQLVSPILERCGIVVSGKIMIELGAGTGRMTRNFASRYEQVLALDVSAEMLSQGHQIHSGQQNICWLRVSGTDLACILSCSTDFVFSYLVLQHLPTQELTLSYVREMLRVLRPGGAFLFQFNGNPEPTMNLRGRVVWGFIDALRSSKLTTLSRAIATVLGLDPSAAGKSWRGAAVGPERIAQTVVSNGGEIREMSGERTPMAWCCGVKEVDAGASIAGS